MWLLRLAILATAAIWFAVVAAFVMGPLSVKLAIVVVIGMVILVTVMLFVWAADRSGEDLG